MGEGEDSHRVPRRIVAEDELLPDCLEATAQLLDIVRPEPNAEAHEGEGGLRATLDQLIPNCLEDGRAVIGARQHPHLPGLSGGPIRTLERATSTFTHGRGRQEAGSDERAHVVEDRPRILAEPVCQLLVRHRLIQGQTENPQTQRVREGAHFGCGRVAKLIGWSDGHFPIGGLLSIA